MRIPPLRTRSRATVLIPIRLSARTMPLGCKSQMPYPRTTHSEAFFVAAMISLCPRTVVLLLLHLTAPLTWQVIFSTRGTAFQAPALDSFPPYGDVDLTSSEACARRLSIAQSTRLPAASVLTSWRVSHCLVVIKVSISSLLLHFYSDKTP